MIVASMVIAALPLVRLFMQKERGAAAKAQLMELVNDELGLLAALIGTLFILWDKPLADPIAAIIVATIIAINGLRLFRENLCFLLGRSPGPEFLARVESLARSVDGVLGVHDLRAEYVGPGTVHAGMHIQVHRGLPLEEANHIAEEVRRQVQQVTGCGYCIIHVEAAEPKALSLAEKTTAGLTGA
ncbi:MAG: cation diffusion facilitator family transporter [candidate division NC10 bacterium]|nr:cation diffusion facilitator family transporter [candidate division NC10 bacterium]